MAISARIEDFIFKNRDQEAAPITLHWRRIYILPTKHGLTFALTLLLLFIGSVNYTLSLGYLLTFFLAALAIVAMLHTFSNLRGIQVRWRTPDPIFAGETATFLLFFENPDNNGRFAIDAIGQGNIRQPFDLPQGSGLARISMLGEKRGVLRPGRVVVETRYPLGLFRAWVRLSPDVYCIVFPTPAKDDLPLPSPDSDDGAGGTSVAGDDELQFLRAYRLGDSPRRIAWHAYARERGLLTKQFAAEASGKIWLDLAQTPESDIEAKLSRLARWILDADTAGIPYGLRLPGIELPPALGEGHQQHCLEQLALYGL